METEAKVLTGHTDVVCSTSIEHIITSRDSGLKQIGILIRQLDKLSQGDPSMIVI
ncbi:hypothetical protein SAMN03159294_5217 [Kosakonia radicincitans]|nr:hypothetical protein SAMN03159294_5217 [Kosakonia radicincitans]